METEDKAKEAIAAYKEAEISFSQAQDKIQGELVALGWEWVKRDISGYSESGDYEYMLVSPRMFEALELAEDIENDTPEMVEEPNYINFPKYTDYIIFG